MKNQNQSFLSKRYRFYYNLPDWGLGIIEDTTSGLRYGCDTSIAEYSLRNCIYRHHVEGEFIEFDSIEELYQGYPELFI